MSTSYPFLAIAKQHGADYGLVLALADVVKRMRDGGLESYQLYWLQTPTERRAAEEFPVGSLVYEAVLRQVQ